MKTDDRSSLAEWFHRLSALDPDAQVELLTEITAKDAALASELESLLAAHHANGVLDRLTDEIAPVAVHPPGAPDFSSGDMSGTTVAQFEVAELIGRGGMGDVYRARDTRLGRDVALKFLPSWLDRDPSLRDRFTVEARVVSSIDHTNVCALYDLGETDERRLFLIMPFYEGRTLKERLAEGPLPAEEAVDVARQTARGLAAAHERGVIHRDIKPSNLLLTERGQVKILDFGVAKLEDVTLTRTGETPGTMSYMSPEQREGGAVDARTDLWSLGAVLYEMLTGQRPAADSGRVEAGLSTVPRPLSEVVTKLLAYDPAERYPDARSLAQDLDVLARGALVFEARPAPSVKRFLAELKRRSVFKVAAVYGAVGFAVIEAADAIFPRIPLPEWTVTLVVWLILLGFPVALVLAWAFEATPGGVRRTRRVRPAILDAIVAQPVGRRWPIGLAGVVGGALLVGAAWFATRADTGGRGPTTTAADGSSQELTIAVMGSSSSGDAGLAEGLIGLLAPGLGNVPGLRTAPENVVSGTWRSRDPTIPDSAAALDVASRVNAHAAVLVSSVSSGQRLRLFANVFSLAPETVPGGSMQVEGHRDSLIALSDALAVQLAGMLMPGQSGQAAAIGSRSTRSLAAFRAFLLGERELRNSDLAASIPHLRQAVSEDTTFALAWHRLSQACGWVAGASGCSGDADDAAVRHAANLPERERLLVLATNDLWGSLSRLRDVEDAVRQNPDDAELWNLLGELYMHNGWRAGISLRAADSAFTRTFELQPRDGDALLHRIEIAQAFFHDPVMAERRIAQREGIIGRADDIVRLKQDLVFDARNPTLEARLSNVPTAEFGGFPFPLAHPLSAPARAMVDEVMVSRGLPLAPWSQFVEEITRGRLSSALRAGDTSERPTGLFFTPLTRACRAYMMRLAGIDLSGTRAADWLAPIEPDSTTPREEYLCRGGFAADEARWADADRWLTRLEARAAIPDDSISEVYRDAHADALRSYLTWRRSATDAAVIERPTRIYINAGESWPVRWWTGQMLRAAGRAEEALSVYESYWLRAWLPAYLQRAEISAELGRHGEARALYETVLALWADAEAPLQPLVAQARQGLSRVGPTEAMTSSATPARD